MFRLSIFIGMISLSACKPVQPLEAYERIYVDDPLMKPGVLPGGTYHLYTCSIREGASPTNAKTGGGCGCN